MFGDPRGGDGVAGWGGRGGTGNPSYPPPILKSETHLACLQDNSQCPAPSRGRPVGSGGFGGRQKIKNKIKSL